MCLRGSFIFSFDSRSASKYFGGFFASIALIVGLQLLLAQCFKDVQLGAARWGDECLKIKRQIAMSRDKPQMLILSGSNALFGFSAKEMATRDNILATNVSVNAGFGRRFILTYGKSLVKRGDLVVLPLEYELYDKPWPAEPDLYYQVLTHDRWYYESLSIVEKLKFVFSIGLTDWLRFIRARIRPDPRKLVGYRSETLNGWGDETNNLKESVTEDYLRTLQTVKPRMFVFDENAYKDLAEFSAYVRQMGGSVVLAYPNLLRSAFDEESNATFLAKLKDCAAKAKMKLIGHPADRCFDLRDAYDTEYHQTTSGQMRCSHMLIQQLLDADVAVPKP